MAAERPLMPGSLLHHCRTIQLVQVRSASKRKAMFTWLQVFYKVGLGRRNCLVEAARSATPGTSRKLSQQGIAMQHCLLRPRQPWEDHCATAAFLPCLRHTFCFSPAERWLKLEPATRYAQGTRHLLPGRLQVNRWRPKGSVEYGHSPYGSMPRMISILLVEPCYSPKIKVCCSAGAAQKVSQSRKTQPGSRAFPPLQNDTLEAADLQDGACGALYE